MSSFTYSHVSELMFDPLIWYMVHINFSNINLQILQSMYIIN